MPIYEYRCENCGERVEVLIRTGDNIPCCPHCGSLLSEKLFSVPYVMSRQSRHAGGGTCCGQEERCDMPPCSVSGTCRRE
jgi:putative FmdB family regulatory protein